MLSKCSILLAITLALASGLACAAPLSPSVQMVISPALNPTLRAAPSYGTSQSANHTSGGGGGIPVADMAAIKEMERQVEELRKQASEQPTRAQSMPSSQ